MLDYILTEGNMVELGLRVRVVVGDDSNSQPEVRKRIAWDFGRIINNPSV